MRNSDQFPNAEEALLIEAAQRRADEVGGRPPVPAEMGWKMLQARTPSLAATAIASAKRRGQGKGQRLAFIGASIAGAIALFAGVAWHNRSAVLDRARIYHTAPKEQSIVHLADGSVMRLAPATTVTVTPGHVRVVGEAYFTVALHSSRPVVVQTQNAVVQVLGTKFAVRQYAAEHTSRIVVEEGKVGIRSANSVVSGVRSEATQAVLTANMIAHVTDSATTVVSTPLASDLTAWTQGRLVFKDTPLGDIVTELERVYGVDIHVADTTLIRQPITVTAVFSKQPVTQLLDFITRVVDAHYRRVGNGFVIAAGRASTSNPQYDHFPHQEKLYGR